MKELTCQEIFTDPHSIAWEHIKKDAYVFEILEDISMLDKYINSDEENFVIGGATMYKLLMPYCNKMYITEIDKEFEGDVSFPEIDKSVWKVTSTEKGPKDGVNDFEYEYVTYEKI